MIGGKGEYLKKRQTPSAEKKADKTLIVKYGKPILANGIKTKYHNGGCPS